MTSPAGDSTRSVSSNQAVPPLIGKSLPRKEGAAKVTGKAIYVDDMKVAGCLYGKTVRSKIPRGLIRKIHFKQEGYYNDSPYNVIRLILGKQGPEDTDANNRYTRAAAFFKQWQQESILKRDAAPCLYAYHQEFSGPGGRMTRDGFIALVRLEEREEGVIIPHEKTLDQPKADRLKLMQACSANFSPIFSLYSDPADEINGMLSARCRRVGSAGGDRS